MAEKHNEEFDRYLEQLFRENGIVENPPSGQEPVYRAPAGQYPPPQPYQQAQYQQPYQQPQYQPPQPARVAVQERPPKKKKRHHFVRNLIIILLILAAAVFALWKLFVVQPKADEGTLGARKPGVSTILLAGTDAGNTRTDTMMLATIDQKNGSVSLLSLPRDTITNESFNVPKLNGVYGVYGGGKDGMEALMDQVQNLIGYRPDGYCLIDLNAFVDVVDYMGGIEFNVPQDMYYNDPSQGLYIDLKAGEQKLNGEQAMGLVRYRKGYGMQDLQRISVQRDFIQAAMDQWVKVTKVGKLPGLLTKIGKGITTDLTRGNVLWLGIAILHGKLDGITTETLPGRAIEWYGSYYQVDPYATAELVNSHFNPYQQEITAADLNVRIVY